MKLEEILYKLLMKYTSKTAKHIDDIEFYIKGCKDPFIVFPPLKMLRPHDTFKDVEPLLKFATDVLIPSDYTIGERDFPLKPEKILERNLPNVTKIKDHSEDLDKTLTLKEVKNHE